MPAWSTSASAGGNLLGRWTRDLADGGALQVQAYYDQTAPRWRPAATSRLDTYDVDVQHSFDRRPPRSGLGRGGLPSGRVRALTAAGRSAFLDAGGRDADTWQPVRPGPDRPDRPALTLTLGAEARGQQLHRRASSCRTSGWPGTRPGGDLVWAAALRAVPHADRDRAGPRPCRLADRGDFQSGDADRLRGRLSRPAAPQRQPCRSRSSTTTTTTCGPSTRARPPSCRSADATATRATTYGVEAWGDCDVTAWLAAERRASARWKGLLTPLQAAGSAASRPRHRATIRPTRC